MHLKPALWLPLLVTASMASAAQFESVIDAMAIKSSASHGNNGWEDTAKIKGVKWKWPYNESGAHDARMEGYTKIGTSKNPHIGATRVNVSGARTMISAIKISIANEPADIEIFGAGKARKITTTCDDDSASDTVAFYRFDKAGYKPLYISYQSSWGASGSGSTDFEVAYRLEDVLDIFPAPCKVLK